MSPEQSDRHRRFFKWPGRWRLRLGALLPQWPVGLALMAAGGINVLTGMRYNLFLLGHIEPLSTVTNALAALGSGFQVLLGAGLVAVGVGSLWRLSTAWAFGVLLLAITLGVDIFRGQIGASMLLPAAMLLVLFIFRRHFTRRTILANYLVSLISILAVLAYGTLGTYMLGEGFRPKIKDVVSAFYFTIITLSTVGYGDIVPAVRETRLFVVSLLIVGLSIFATVIASTLGPVISSELSHIFTPEEKRMKRKDHVIMVGAGPIALNALSELAERQIPFVQVVDPHSEPSLPDQPVVKGEPSDDAVLREAGIQTARMIVAAGDEDGENAFISLAAKDINPDILVLAVASSAKSIRRLRLARADLVFAPAAVGSRLLANLIEGNEIPQEFKDLLQGTLRKSG